MGGKKLGSQSIATRTTETLVQHSRTTVTMNWQQHIRKGQESIDCDCTASVSEENSSSQEVAGTHAYIRTYLTTSMMNSLITNKFHFLLTYNNDNILYILIFTMFLKWFHIKTLFMISNNKMNMCLHALYVYNNIFIFIQAEEKTNTLNH